LNLPEKFETNRVDLDASEAAILIASRGTTSCIVFSLKQAFCALANIRGMIFLTRKGIEAAACECR